MTKTSRILILDFKRNVNKLSSCILIITILATVVIFQLGIERYKNAIMKVPEFIEIEQNRVKQYPRYLDFLKGGFMILSVPSTLIAINHNGAAFSDLIGFINNGIGFKLVKPQIGNNIFEKPTGGICDLSWFLLLIGSFALPWGFITFGPKSHDKLKFLLNFANPITVYCGIILSRILLITVCLGIVTLTLWLQLTINGILLSPGGIGHLLVFSLIIEIVLILFFMIGSILGTVGNRLKGATIAVFVWLIVALFWPNVLDSIFSQNAMSSIKPIFKHENHKMNLLVEFEKQVYNNIKKYTIATERNQAFREMSEYYLNNEFKKIEALESEMIEKTEALANEFHFWSILNPVTFYRSVNNELSSRGYNSYLKLYRYLKTKQRGFLRYIYDKRFYENDPVVKSFLKDDDYIFHLESSLPKYFGSGVLLNVVYILVVFGIGYLRFGRVVFAKPEKAALFEGIDLKLVSGKHVVIRLYEDQEDVASQVFNAFSGRDKRFTGKISLDGESIVHTGKKSFAYLPDPKVIPGEIKAATLLGLSGLSRGEIKKLKAEPGNKLNKTFSELARVERVKLLLKTVVNEDVKIYLLHNLMTGLTIDELKEVFKHLESEDNTIVEMNLEQTCNLHPDHYQYYGINFDGTTFKERLYHKM